MPSLLTPTTLSARESNNGDEEEEYGDDTVEYKDEGGTGEDKRGLEGVGEEEENYNDDQEFEEGGDVVGRGGPINPQIDDHDLHK